MTPSTPSGRRLWDDVRIHNEAQRVRADDKHDAKWVSRILDIEAEAGREAVEAYRSDLAEKVRAMRFWIAGYDEGFVSLPALLRLIEGEPHADPE